jgi:hypothetical protein
MTLLKPHKHKVAIVHDVKHMASTILASELFQLRDLLLPGEDKGSDSAPIVTKGMITGVDHMEPSLEKLHETH